MHPTCALFLFFLPLPWSDAAVDCVPKYLLAYAYLGNKSKTISGETCTRPSTCSRFYDAYKSHLTKVDFGGYMWKQNNDTQKQRQIHEPPSCETASSKPQVPQYCYLACEDMMAATCTPFMLSRFPGLYRGSANIPIYPSGTRSRKPCSQLCTIGKREAGVRCELGLCQFICEHYLMKCDPLESSQKHLATLQRHKFLLGYVDQDFGIVNLDSYNCVAGDETCESAVKRAIGNPQSGLYDKATPLCECDDDSYKQQAPVHSVDCISEDALRFFTYLNRKALATQRNISAYGNPCKESLKKKPPLCTTRTDGSHPPVCDAKSTREPCYKNCHHALITCVPPYGPAYSEAQDTIIALSYPPEALSSSRQPYMGAKATSYNGTECKSFPYGIGGELAVCTNAPIEDRTANESSISRPFFPYCFTDDRKIEPCFPVCRKHDPQLNPIRHLGYRTRIELERIEKESPANKPPLILFPSRRKQGGFEVFCGTKMQYADLFKQWLGPIECFDSEPIATGKKPTPLYHEYLQFKGSMYVETKDNEGRKHEAMPHQVFDKQHPGCRVKEDFMTTYTGATAVTVNGHICERWDSVDVHRFKDDQFPEGNIHYVKNLCRNPDRSPCGPWCYIKESGGFHREPCFSTCVQIKKESHLSCLPGPILQWTDKRYFPLRKVSRSRTGRPCVAAGAEEHEDADQKRPVYCKEHERNVYIGPTCLVDKENELYEPCFYACEHRSLTCIDRDHMLNIEYNGPKDETINGRPCIQWRELLRPEHVNQTNAQWRWIFVESENSDFARLFNETRLDHNQCLNILTLINKKDHYMRFPGLDPVVLKGPICFVDVQGFYVPEPCFKTCEDKSIEYNNCIEQSKIRTEVYTGFRNYTRSGKACLGWDVRTMNQILPWELSGPLHNYCRNYGFHEQGPWCYVDDHDFYREPCFQVCSHGKRLAIFREADHKWYYHPCRENPRCCKARGSEEGEEEEDWELLAEFDKIWPDPMPEIKETMRKAEEGEKWILYFGIYAAVQVFLCICSLWWIGRGTDPEKERENMALEEETEQLNEIRETLAKKAKKRREKRSASSSDSRKSKSGEWFTRLRRSRTSSAA